VTSAQSSEVQQRLAILKQKAIDNTMTQDDMREAIALMRQDRKSAHAASDTARRAKAKTAVPDAKSLLAELGIVKK
jgi:hypothetical protein